jgi:hypothetical protein
MQCLLICALGGSLLAQTSILSGVVADESGAVIPRARVVLTAANGSVRTVTTDDHGAYSVRGLDLGPYTLSASAPDLTMAKPLSISILPGAQSVNIELTVASTTQQVTVKENAGPMVSTDSSSNASALVLKGDDLEALGDSPEDLQADLQALAGPSAGPGGGSIFIDGFSGGELPPKSAIREIRINQNPFSPEYDKLGFGRIEIFTKPGADNWRGSINYNLQNDDLNTRNPYSPQKAPLRLNEIEGGVSGPLGHRTSFTFDGQREQVDNGSIVNAVSVDPSTLGIISLGTVRTTPQVRISLTPRVDYQLNEKNTITFRYQLTRLDIDNAGIGSFDLVSRGYQLRNTNQTVQLSDTAVLGTVVNETRFQYYRAAAESTANSLDPAILVLGSFNGGGSQTGRSLSTANLFELQNYTSTIRGAHAIKFGARMREQLSDAINPQNFGGTFTFGGGLAPVLDANNQPVLDQSGQPVLAAIQGIDRYRRTLLLEQTGLSPSQAAALGGGPTQFSINAGNPEISGSQFDIGLFAGDEWRVRSNVTLNLGLRYETQTNIHDARDWAPRIGVAWAPGANANGNRPKTVIRAGFGMFYDRFILANTLTAERYNGIVEQQYVLTNPTFFPNIPSVATLATAQSPQVIQKVASDVRAPYIMQSAISIERQLPANTTLAVTYTNSHGLHELRSEDINAPLPGTGIYPLGTPNPLFLMTTSGIYNQNQLMSNVNTKVNRNVSLFGFYVLNKAMSNTDGLGTYPANPYNFAGEYGPAATDVRNRGSIGGSINLKWHVRMSPYLNLQSGAPFDITTGSDPFGTTLYNARPGLVSGDFPGAIQTKYGLLDPNPVAGERLLPRNYGRGPGQFMLNLRIGKTWGFGGEKGKAKVADAPIPAGGGGPRPPGSPGNGGGITGGVASTSRRYNLTVSASFRNLTNHTNPGPIIGNITSPLFGTANQSAGSGGSGISESANNRRVEIQIRLAF